MPVHFGTVRLLAQQTCSFKAAADLRRRVEEDVHGVSRQTIGGRISGDQVDVVETLDAVWPWVYFSILKWDYQIEVQCGYHSMIIS